MTSTLRLRRLSVFAKNTAVYSEAFHDGVNIIHGDNGSGKSTITDFIFYALGGDLRDWRNQAANCDFVLAEVKVNDSTITLRRDVASNVGQPMQIFFGVYEDAIEAGPAAWSKYPYRRPEQGYSFSQVIFKALGIPESISAGSSNMTLHQVLRLLYGDQMTPIQRIFRQENFDTWEIRQAVGDFLCGIGGHELYQLQLDLRAVSAEHDDVSKRLRNLTTVASSYGDNILAEQIDATEKQTLLERSNFVNQLEELLKAEDSSDSDSIAERAKKESLQALQKAKREVATIEDRIETLAFEIQDSERFIEYLTQALSEFDDAAVTFFSLGHLRFEFCPSCFTPTTAKFDASHCHLCGSAIAANPSDGRNIAVRLDLEMQLKESKELVEQNRSDLTNLRGALRSAKTRYDAAFEASELTRRGFTSERDATVSELSRRIGYLDSELAVLKRRSQLSLQLAELSALKESLNNRISRTKDRIAAIISAQDKRKRVAYTAVAERTKQLLNLDLAEHSDLLPVDEVTFSFAEDWVAINGDKNRAGSASSMVVMKNSFLVGLYLASLHDSAFLLPRFMLLDNIEDKGMVQERSWNFQRQVIETSKGARFEHQIILTTSKIAPELVGSAYVIGRKLTRQTPSLVFPK